MKHTVLSGVLLGLISVSLAATAMPPPLRKEVDKKEVDKKEVDKKEVDQRTKKATKTATRTKTATATVFSTQVRSHFRFWDLDKDGKLTVEEIHKAMVNPRIKGEAAAAVAALRCIERYAYTRYEKEMPPFTLQALTEYEAADADVRIEKFGARGDDFDAYFKEFKRKIEATPRKLFPQRMPRLEAVKQGYLGDCFFMSMVGAFVAMHPEKVRRMVKEEENNRYIVTFAGARGPITVPAPTDAEIALNSTAEQNGLWLTVIEKAYAKHENLKSPLKEREKSVTDRIAEGGYASAVIAMFTGHGLITVPSNSPKFLDSLKSAVDDRCMICTGLRPKKDVPQLYHPHVYAVIGYDQGTNRVTVFDCIGSDFTPKAKPGPRNGFEMKDGVFTMSLADFKAVFTGITYEDVKTAVVEEKKRKKS